MSSVFGFMALIFIAVLAVYILRANDKQKSERIDQQKQPVLYRYKRKSFLMTKSENEFFQRLTSAVGGEYFIFPQIRLSSLLDHRVHGQNWKPALGYINQKSVDFAICDKQLRRPLVAIELDDWSHDQKERQQRDVNVENIFRESGMPLIRFREVGELSNEEIRQQILAAIPPPAASKEVLSRV
jgi:very-short-patch-repair endonuclease